MNCSSFKRWTCVVVTLSILFIVPVSALAVADENGGANFGKGTEQDNQGALELIDWLDQGNTDGGLFEIKSWERAIKGIKKEIFSLAEELLPMIAENLIPGEIGEIVASTLVELLGETSVAEVEGFQELLGKEPGVTTGIQDARSGVSILDDYNPEPTDLNLMPDGSSGGKMIGPGTYTTNLQSLYLNAGKFGYTDSNGYVFAPLEGEHAEIIANMIERVTKGESIPREEIQSLLWAIIGRAEFEELSPDIRSIAESILTKNEINFLKEKAVEIIMNEVLKKPLSELRSYFSRKLGEEAGNFLANRVESKINLRAWLNIESGEIGSPGEYYQNLEGIAVLEGEAPVSDSDVDIKVGRWSYHPDNYFVRYFPKGNDRLEVELTIPPECSISRDRLGRITSLRNAKGDRLDLEYDSDIVELDFKGSNGTKGCGLTKATYFSSGVDGDVSAGTTIDTSGSWMFVGLPDANCRANSNHKEPEGFDGLIELVNYTRVHRAEIEGFCDNTTGVENSVELGLLAYRIGELDGSDSPALNLILEAWQDSIIKAMNGTRRYGSGAISDNPRDLIEFVPRGCVVPGTISCQVILGIFEPDSVLPEPCENQDQVKVLHEGQWDNFDPQRHIDMEFLAELFPTNYRIVSFALSECDGDKAAGWEASDDASRAFVADIVFSTNGLSLALDPWLEGETTLMRIEDPDDWMPGDIYIMGDYQDPLTKPHTGIILFSFGDGRFIVKNANYRLDQTIHTSPINIKTWNVSENDPRAYRVTDLID